MRKIATRNHSVARIERALIWGPEINEEIHAPAHYSLCRVLASSSFSPSKCHVMFPLGSLFPKILGVMRLSASLEGGGGAELTTDDPASADSSVVKTL